MLVKQIILLIIKKMKKLQCSRIGKKFTDLNMRKICFQLRWKTLEKFDPINVVLNIVRSQILRVRAKVGEVTARCSCHESSEHKITKTF